MEIRQMRYFLAVAETLHFRQASKVLHLSQPTLSLQIQNLEEELGVELFRRTSRRVELTRAGEALQVRCRVLLEGVDDAVSLTQRVARGLEGRLSVTFVSSATSGVLPRAIRQLKLESPGIELELDDCAPQEQIDRILQCRVDLGFLYGDVEHNQLETRVIQRDALLAAVPADAEVGDVVDLSQFREETIFVPRPGGGASSSFHGRIRKAFQEADVEPERLVYSSIVSGLGFVAAGVGIALVPASVQTAETAGVKFLPLAHPVPPVALVAVWNRSAKSQILDRFLEILDQTRVL